MKQREYLTRKEAAEFTGFSEQTLAKWLVLGKGPRCIKIGTARSSRVRYPLEALREFIEGGGQPEREARA